jgi:peptide chain release factor subunit 1
MLGDEYGTASNIKSRVNRQSVMDAITSTQQRLKLFSRVPPNGLIIYCGTVLTDEGKEKKLTIDIEPFKPINQSLYMCDNKFHTQALSVLLEDDAKFGFIVMDGNGCLFGTLAGSTRDILHKLSVELPKKVFIFIDYRYILDFNCSTDVVVNPQVVSLVFVMKLVTIMSTRLPNWP